MLNLTCNLVVAVLEQRGEWNAFVEERYQILSKSYTFDILQYSSPRSPQ